MHLCVFRRVSFISLCWKRLAEALWLLYVLCEKKCFMSYLFSLMMVKS